MPLATVSRMYNDLAMKIYNRWFGAPPIGDPDIDEIRVRVQSRRSDISTHLETIFLTTVLARPRLIVELGVRGGESSFALQRAARRTGAWLVSCDVDDSSKEVWYEHAFFIQSDDVKFAGEFAHWASATGIPTEIDVLFIDTSHEYEHTVAEIHGWFPHLSDAAIVIFHDTRISGFWPRHDLTFGWGWDNRRGVMRAIEQFLDVSLDESKRAAIHLEGWTVAHDPRCSGLTLLRRIPGAES